MPPLEHPPSVAVWSAFGRPHAVLWWPCAAAMAGEDDKNLAEGTLGYLRGSARWLTYLARGCDELDVVVCEGLIGRDLYDSLKRAGDSARALLTATGWPVPISNRIAYGFAASVLPVWLLLAPRDYLSTFMKIGVIVLLALSLLISRPVLQAEAAF